MDRYGGRLLLVLSFASSAACYGLTASASSLPHLYLSRLPTVLQHAVLAARAIVTQLSDDRVRAGCTTVRQPLEAHGLLAWA